MHQVPLSIEDSVDRVGQIPADLAHPQTKVASLALAPALSRNAGSY